MYSLLCSLVRAAAGAWVLLAPAVLLAAPPTASPPPAGETAAAADPLNPQAPVPRLRYQPALQGFRPLADTPPGDWRALNEQVLRVGGWRSYLRQAHAPEPPEPPASAASAASAASPQRHDHPTASPPPAGGRP